VPTIVQFEMAKWLTREVTRDRRNRFLAYLGRCQVIELSSRIALQAAYLSVEHKLSVADAIIYTTALLNDAELLTCDAHFEGLPQVIYLPKIAA
jgi:predicted nucleic acid-binding protein